MKSLITYHLQSEIIMKRCILLFSKDYESQVNHKYIVVCMNGLIDVLMVYVPVRGDTDIPITHCLNN